jgi:hypothetical protein
VLLNQKCGGQPRKKRSVYADKANDLGVFSVILPFWFRDPSSASKVYKSEPLDLSSFRGNLHLQMNLGDRLLLLADRSKCPCPHIWTGRGLKTGQRTEREKEKTLPDIHNVIDVIAHRHEQIEKQFATDLHLHLHGSAPLESLTTSNDES